MNNVHCSFLLPGCLPTCAGRGSSVSPCMARGLSYPYSDVASIVVDSTCTTHSVVAPFGTVLDANSKAS